MADHFLTKTRVAAEDFVEADGRPVLERYNELKALLNERAGPEVASLFAEPLISRGNDAAPPTVSWYADRAGEARALESLPVAERERVELFLADHLRPLRAMAADPQTAELALGALTVMGQGDVLVADGHPILVNWGLMPGGGGANATARPGHYDSTLGRFLPMTPGGTPNGNRPPPVAASGAAAEVASGGTAKASARVADTPGGSPPAAAPRRLSPIAWVPLLLLLILAGLTLVWLLMPGNRLFHASAPPVVTDEAALAAAQAHNESLRARQEQLQAAIDGAVCRADGVLVLPGDVTLEGVSPPKLGTALPPRAEAAPDALLPPNPDRVVLNEPANEGEAGKDVSLLSVIEARTVLILASGSGKTRTGTGFFVGPGLIVTNQHVIEPAQTEGGEIVVAGKAMPEPQQAELVKALGPLAQTGADFALLRVSAQELPAFTVLRPQGSLKLTNVVAAGYPGDVLKLDAGFAALKAGDNTAVPDLTVTDGTVNTEQQIAPMTRLLMHSAPLSQGNSGGPLVDMCGRLVGVNSFVRKGRMQNRGYALATTDLLAFLEGTGAAPRVVEDACAPIVVQPRLTVVPAQEPEKKK